MNGNLGLLFVHSVQKIVFFLFCFVLFFYLNFNFY